MPRLPEENSPTSLITGCRFLHAGTYTSCRFFLSVSAIMRTHLTCEAGV